jgi:hypothetical protein
MLTFRTIDSVTIATDRSGDAFQPVRQQDYRSQLQPRERAVAPPAPYYGGYYGGYYDPFYYPYGYYPYGYGFGFGGFYGPSVIIRGGGGFRGGGFRGGGRRR